MTKITDEGRQRAADEPDSFDAMTVWREAKIAYAPKLAELDEKYPQAAAIADGLAATVIASAVAPLLAELAAVKAERAALRAENERLRDVGHDIIAAAYATGATDVHNHWAAGNVEGEADFTESADDYARAALQGGQSNEG